MTVLRRELRKLNHYAAAAQARRALVGIDLHRLAQRGRAALGTPAGAATAFGAGVAVGLLRDAHTQRRQVRKAAHEGRRRTPGRPGALASLLHRLGNIAASVASTFLMRELSMHFSEHFDAEAPDGRDMAATQGHE